VHNKDNIKEMTAFSKFDFCDIFIGPELIKTLGEEYYFVWWNTGLQGLHCLSWSSGHYREKKSERKRERDRERERETERTRERDIETERERETYIYI